MKKNAILMLGVAIFSTQVATITLAQEVIPEGSVAQATDVTMPSDVENVKATAGDESATLTWDAATDNIGVTGYKIYYGTTSVTKDGGNYNFGPLDVGNKITHTIGGLENDSPYFFAVTAYDSVGNESENYSFEVTATPKAGLKSADTVAPKVTKAEANSRNLVKIEFSEAVVLPAVGAQNAFSIKNDVSGEILEVVKAVVDPEVVAKNTVILTTADQTKDAKYLLTAGIQVKDLANNPIISGTSDTALFTGLDTFPEVTAPVVETKPAAEENKDTTPPAFEATKALSATQIEIKFSEGVLLKTDPRASFIITEAKDLMAIVDVQAVNVSADGKTVTITTGNLKNEKYNVLAVGVKDNAGNEMPVENSATTVDGPVTTETPEKPVDMPEVVVTPEAAEAFAAKLMENAVLRLSWRVKEENLKDMANFVLYVSTDRGATYGEGKALDLKTISFDLAELKENMVYYFKLTSKTAAGAESEGLVTYFTLPATGPGLLFLLAGSAGAGVLVKGKRRK